MANFYDKCWTFYIIKYRILIIIIVARFIFDIDTSRCIWSSYHGEHLTEYFKEIT